MKAAPTTVIVGAAVSTDVSVPASDTVVGCSPKSGRWVITYMFDIGEKPGVGRYCCKKCNWSVNLDDASDRLPPCGSCGKGQETKYVRC